MGSRDAAAPLTALDIDTLDVDPKRPSAKAKCPFCGGTYVAGYRRTVPDEAVFYHSIPRCDQALTLHPIAFLREARLNGARAKRITD